MKTKIATGLLVAFIALIVAMTLPVQACILYGDTPGFWKNHTEVWPDGVEPTDTLGDWFIFPPELDIYTFTDDSLLEALNYGGGPGLAGGARNFLRAAVAALLNAEYYGKWSPAEPPYVDGYPYSTDEVVDYVNAVLATLDRDTMLLYAYIFDSYNNQQFPW
jgi:hypothetical protein